MKEYIVVVLIKKNIKIIRFKVSNRREIFQNFYLIFFNSYSEIRLVRIFEFHECSSGFETLY